METNNPLSQQTPIENSEVMLIKEKSNLPFIVSIFVLFFFIGMSIYFLIIQKNILITSTLQKPNLPNPVSISVVNVAIPTPTLTQANDWVVYSNPKLGFKIKYPSQYYIRYYPATNDEAFYITDINDKTNVRDANIYIDFFPTEYETTISDIKDPRSSTFQDTANLSFKEYVERGLLPICGAMGTTGEQYCDKVTQMIPYTSSGGVSGYKVYLHLVVAEIGKQNKESIRGPIYLLDISEHEKSAVRGLMIDGRFGGAMTAETNTLNLVEDIVNSLTFK